LKARRDKKTPLLETLGRKIGTIKVKAKSSRIRRLPSMKDLRKVFGGSV